MKQFKISIPKPCHEDWNTMTPKEKGRFCSSCAKTVVDFTKKSNEEIQEYLTTNRGQRVCGHFYRKQLDSIVIQIPETTFLQQLSFQKLFILSLLLVMGTTLFSCKTDTGKVQKIEKVELIDSIVKTEKTIDSVQDIELGFMMLSEKSCNKDSVKVPLPPITSVGVTVIETTGEVEEAPVKKPFDINKVKEAKEEEIIDGEIEIMGDIIETPKLVGPYSIYEVDIPPKFKETKKASKEKLKKIFDDKMKDFVIKNFDISITKNLGLSQGKKRIYIKFIIDESGKVTDFQVRVPHPVLKKKMIALFEKLPDFIPAKKDGENVSMSYVQPITFVVE